MSWLQRGADILGEINADQMGYTISLSGNGEYVAIGSLNLTTGTKGKVYVYAWNGISWNQRGTPIEGQNNNDEACVVSLSSDGSVLAIGANRNDTAAINAGQVRVYSWNGIDWEQRGSSINGQNHHDQIGISVSLSANGSVIAIGGSNGSTAGRIQVLYWSGTEWVPRGSVIIGSNGDYLRGVIISGDGNTMVTSAYGYNSGTGLVRVYEWNSTEWVQRGSDLLGNAVGDYFMAQSITSDGLTLAVGAFGNDQNGNNAGLVKIYTWNGTSWILKGSPFVGESPGDSLSVAKISSDGTTIAIGSTNKNTNTGQVRIYRWIRSVWVQQGGNINGTAPEDLFGASISISSDGSFVSIGAIQTGLTSKGYVRNYSFSRIDAGSWVRKGDDIDGKAADDYSGRSISLSADGSIVAIGATGNDENGSNSGHVRVYAWNGSAWAQRGNDINGEAVDNYSGYSVSLSSDGSIVAIGAIGNNDLAGHVRVYAWNGSAWVKRGDDIDGEAAGDFSGWSVSLSSDGSIVAIGAIANSQNGFYRGHVRVYAWNGSAWVKRGDDIDGEAAGNQSGWSVSLSSDGSIVAIGANYNHENGLYAGHVRVYAWNGSAWVKRGDDIDGEAAGDNSGWSVSLSSDGSIVAIGAILNNGNSIQSGHVRVYAWNGSAWAQRGDDIDGEAIEDQFGSSVSLSSDGSIVAISAINNDGSGNNAGHVRVYAWNGSAWVKRGADIHGEYEGDYSGTSVSLSADGSIVAIGAINNDGSGNNAGHTRVYNFLSNNTSLSTFTVNGEAVTGGSSINLANGTTSVAVVATPTNGAATAQVSGASELSTGSNSLTVTVTAQDGIATHTYMVTLVVAPPSSNDTSLSTFTVNGEDAIFGSSINLANGTTSVTVVATPTDANATVQVSGASGLSTGNNTLSVTVTAQDGVTTQTYTMTLVVAAPPLSNDISLSLFTVNGQAVTGGSSINLANGTTSVTVVATPTDANATAQVSGASGLSTGNNTLSVTVTAQDGVTTQTYTVTLVVAAPGGSGGGSSGSSSLPESGHVPVQIDFKVSIDANSKIALFGEAAPSVTNPIVAEVKLLATALYNADTSKGLIEIWEPSDALGKIRCQLANDGGDGEGAPDLSGAYQVAAKALATGLQAVLNGAFDCSGASPYDEPNYADTEAYQKQADFGRVALGAFAHYLFGHVDATAAITNDVAFRASMLATYDVSGINVENWNFASSNTHANLALRLVKEIVRKGKAGADGGDITSTTLITSDVSGADTVTGSLAHIVKQVIGQDSSRANMVDGSQRTLDKHLLLRFFPGDVIYMQIALEPPTVEVSGTGANPPSNSLVSKDDVTYTLKITLA